MPALNKARIGRRLYHYQQGAHDRWSKEASKREVRIVFLGTAVHDPQSRKMQRYALNVKACVYYNEDAEVVEFPQVAFMPNRIMAVVTNPVRNQRVFIEQISIGNMQILQRAIALEEFQRGGIDIGDYPIQLSGAIRVKVSVKLDV